MELQRYLDKGAVKLDLACKTKREAIEALLGVVCDANGLADRKTILKTVFAREDDRSTGIGNGVAIPHARTDVVEAIYVALGRSQAGIPWGSADGRPVRFAFLVVGPQKASEEYLRVLADISRLMTRATVRNALLDAKSPQEILKIVGDTNAREGKR